MRKRAASAVLGAVAVLAGLAAPGAVADEAQGDVQLGNVTFDGGKNIVIDV